jgi:hypothetical protein|nr:antitoxin MazE family protein [uncultured Halomonas sp.]|tara:strand:+ start:3572 stop:3802 length:231 start_codon:yes stop_codon:yes gene_type:complete
MVATNINTRVQKHRASLRASGLRPIQIWVPDTRRPGFADEVQRQCQVVAAADAGDHELDSFMDAALLDIDSDEWEA